MSVRGIARVDGNSGVNDHLHRYKHGGKGGEGRGKKGRKEGREEKREEGRGEVILCSAGRYCEALQRTSELELGGNGLDRW